MNLLEIRKWFIDDSGRFDLVADPSTAAADVGADKYINAGIRLIDRLLNHPKQAVIAERNLAANADTITIPRAQAVKHVYIEYEDRIRYLERLELPEFNHFFPEGTVEAGIPTAYAIGVNRQLVSTETTEFSQTEIVVGVQPDIDIDVFVAGHFPSSALTDNDDFNFWTIEHPETVVQAALYSLERFYRNTQGMHDHMDAIMRDVQGIDYDVVEQEIAERDQMVSSFNERRGRRRYYGNF